MNMEKKSSKYFYSLEKAKYNAKTCFKIINDDGQEITSCERILEEQRKFYEELYKVDNDINFTMQNHTDIKVPVEIKEKPGITDHC